MDQFVSMVDARLKIYLKICRKFNFFLQKAEQLPEWLFGTKVPNALKCRTVGREFVLGSKGQEHQQTPFKKLAED